MATHSSILAWKIPWTEEPGWGARGGLGSIVHAVEKSWTRLSARTHTVKNGMLSYPPTLKKESRGVQFL